MRRRYLLLAVAVLAGCGGETGGAKETTTEDGVTTVKRVDLDTGLEFAVQTTAGFGTTLTVTPTRDLPAGVRTQLTGQRLTATCDVPGTKVATLAHDWPDLDEPFTANLQVTGDADLAAAATGCRLELDGRTFASVSL